MKLHLPVRLFKAVLAVVALATALPTVAQTEYNPNLVLNRDNPTVALEQDITINNPTKISPFLNATTGSSWYTYCTTNLETNERYGVLMGYTSADAEDKKGFAVTNAAISGNLFGIHFSGLDQSILKKGPGITFNQLKHFKLEGNTVESLKNGGFILVQGYIHSGLEDNSEIVISKNDSVLLKNNKIKATGTGMDGGVIHASSADLYIDKNVSFEISGNAYTTEKTDITYANGGVIYCKNVGKFSMSNNGDVNISGNSLVVPMYEYAENDWRGATATGGAVAIEHSTTALWDANKSISLSLNRAEGGVAHGGALYMNTDTANLTIRNTIGKVSFNENSAIAKEDTSYGGAIVLNGGAVLSMKDNVEVEFSGNEAKSQLANNDPKTQGGAICVAGTSQLEISGSDSVKFVGNTAINTAEDQTGKVGETPILTVARAIGGAIAATNANSKVLITDNDEVVFSGNGVVVSGSGKGYDKNGNNYVGAMGGAIYSAGTVSLRDNDSVVFEKNYEKNGDSFLLRSIYAQHYTPTSTEKYDLNLSAREGGNITFKDSITVSGDLILNETYNGKAQTGTIIFTGATTESDLNEIIASYTTEGQEARKATADEIAASRTSTVEGNVQLNAGTLSIEDGAMLEAGALTMSGGAELVFDLTELDMDNLPSLTVDRLSMTDGAAISLIFNDVYSLKAALGIQEAVAAVNALTDEPVVYSGTDNSTILNKLITFTSAKDLAEVEDIELTLKYGTAWDDNGNITSSTEYTTSSITLGAVATAVPEPTTATLSLLALAGLCARRRRR